MQWLIDLIIGIAKNQIGYFDRGDPAADDFTIINFVRDNTWRQLDLSAIVPEHARCVSLKVSLRSTVVPLRIQFRRNGMAFGFNSIALWTNVANFFIGGVFSVSCDTDQIIEYRAVVGAWDRINVVVCGWWLR